eukprot:scaffold1146_cov399-Prasinococcus_capsulatus_cf.AAC.58
MDRYEALESGPSTPTTQRSRRSSQARRSSGLSYSSAAESNGEGHDVDGLRALLEAEREAQAIVQRARQGKLQTRPLLVPPHAKRPRWVRFVSRPRSEVQGDAGRFATGEAAARGLPCVNSPGQSDAP